MPITQLLGDAVLVDASVNDVFVDGVSVVNNKIANISLTDKQDKLTAGSNVSIADNIISATDTVYDDTSVKNRLTTIEAMESVWNSKQDPLTAGDNITISADGTISATDTTYTAGTNITISEDNVISASGGGSSTYDIDLVINFTPDSDIETNHQMWLDYVTIGEGEEAQTYLNSFFVPTGQQGVIANAVTRTTIIAQINSGKTIRVVNVHSHLDYGEAESIWGHWKVNSEWHKDYFGPDWMDDFFREYKAVFEHAGYYFFNYDGSVIAMWPNISSEMYYSPSKTESSVSVFYAGSRALDNSSIATYPYTTTNPYIVAVGILGIEFILNNVSWGDDKYLDIDAIKQLSVLAPSLTAK